MNSRHISQDFARSCNILFNYVHNKIKLAVMKKSESYARWKMFADIMRIFVKSFKNIKRHYSFERLFKELK